jgi:hypothetical protein
MLPWRHKLTDTGIAKSGMPRPYHFWRLAPISKSFLPQRRHPGSLKYMPNQSTSGIYLGSIRRKGVSPLFFLSMRENMAGSMKRSAIRAMVKAAAVTMPKLILGLKRLNTNMEKARLKTMVVKTMAAPA